MRFILYTVLLFGFNFHTFSNPSNDQSSKRIFIDFNYALSGLSWTEFESIERDFSERLVFSWKKKISESNNYEVFDMRKDSDQLSESDVKLNIYLKLKKLSYEEDVLNFSYKIDYTFLNKSNKVLELGNNLEGNHSIVSSKKEVPSKLAQMVFSLTSSPFSNLTTVLSRNVDLDEKNRISLKYSNFNEVADFLSRMRKDHSGAVFRITNLSSDKAIIEVEGRRNNVELAVDSAQRNGRIIQFENSRAPASID